MNMVLAEGHALLQVRTIALISVDCVDVGGSLLSREQTLCWHEERIVERDIDEMLRRVREPPLYDSIDQLEGYNQTPTRRCRRCPTEYKAMVKGQRGDDGTLAHELEIARWIDLGRYRDAYSEEFMALAGQSVGTRDWSAVASMRERVLQAISGGLST